MASSLLARHCGFLPASGLWATSSRDVCVWVRVRQTAREHIMLGDADQSGPVVRNRKSLTFAAAICLMAWLAGCNSEWYEVPVPDGFPTSAPADPPAPMSIIYVTDRAWECLDAKSLQMRFSNDRSDAVCVGKATVVFARKNQRELKLKVAGFHAVTRPSSWIKAATIHNKKVHLRAAEEVTAARKKIIEDAVKGALAANKDPSNKDIYLYVHGYNNTIDEATRRLASLAHHLNGGVPVVYSWAAGKDGLLGYPQDCESAEYTVVHLKQTLWVLLHCDGVERVHIIAHSRGAYAVMTALRELWLAEGGGPQQPLATPGERESWATLKPLRRLGTLVMAAPDIDPGVFKQRFIEEGMLHVAEQMVIYCRKDDFALAVAGQAWGLLRSPVDLVFQTFAGVRRARVGSIDISDMDAHERELLRVAPNFQIVSCGRRGVALSGHDYIFTNPRAVADLIRVLKGDWDSRSIQKGDSDFPPDNNRCGYWKLAG